MMPQGGKPGEPNLEKVTGMRRAEEGDYGCTWQLWAHMAHQLTGLFAHVLTMADQYQNHSYKSLEGVYQALAEALGMHVQSCSFHLVRIAASA